MSLTFLLAIVLSTQAPAQDSAAAPATATPDPQIQPQRHARVSSATLAKMIVHHVEPHYPLAAQQQHLQGTIVLHVLIGRDGKVDEATPMSGPEIFRQASIDAVKEWRYKPFVVNGTAIEFESTVTLNFRSS